MKNRYKIGDFLLRKKEPVIVEDHNRYKRAKIRINHKGISIRDEVKGSDIKTKKQFLIRSGQFLLSKIDARNGAFGIVPNELDEGIITGNFWTFELVNKIVLIEYFKAFTESQYFLNICIKASSGTTNRKYLDENVFLNIDLEIPSIETQKELLKNYFYKKEKIGQLKKEILLQEMLLTKLRQSIFQEAIQGKLTQKWREDNPNIEPASELLKRVKAEKENLIKEKKIKKEKPLALINEDEIPFDIPDTWEWCKFGKIILDIEAGKSPKCNPEPASLNRWGVIKISAISWGEFNENENKTLPLDIEPFKDKEIKSGDFIMTRANTSELVGRSVIVREGVREKLLLNDKTLRLQISSFIQKEYINLFNNGILARSHYVEIASGTSDSMKNISRVNIKEMKLIIPPLEEQKELVSHINEHNKLCGDIERFILKSKNDVQYLLQTILSELLGDEGVMLSKTREIKKQRITTKREIKFDTKTLLMELTELLKEHGKLNAEDLWKMSKFPKDIDAFYAELKDQIEDKKTIKESKEKGYLELV